MQGAPYTEDFTWGRIKRRIYEEEGTTVGRRLNDLARNFFYYIKIGGMIIDDNTIVRVRFDGEGIPLTMDIQHDPSRSEYPMSLTAAAYYDSLQVRDTKHTSPPPPPKDNLILLLCPT